MPKLLPKRKPGRPRKPRTAIEKDAAALESQIRAKRRRVSGKDRAFIAKFVEQGYKDPDKAASDTGFREPGIGWKLVERLRDLIDAERARTIMGEQMELEEALRLTANLGRTAQRDVDRLAALRTILQVHGALSDKPLPVSDRRTLTRQVAEIIDRVQRAASAKPGTRVRVRAMLGAAVEAEADTQSLPQSEGNGDSATLDSPAHAIVDVPAHAR